MEIDAIRGHIAAAGLAFRGAFHPDDGDLAPSGAETIVLVGCVGSAQWPTFAGAEEAADGLPDPLDRWSRRVIGALSVTVGAAAVFPFGDPPFLPFQRWARKAEPVHASPIGILIHPDWGLWHAYRGALVFAERLGLGATDRRLSPCESCAAKPCLSACPVGAFGVSGYDVAACISHIEAPAGFECLGEGCRARRACPVGADYRYIPLHAQFHLRAFQRAHRRETAIPPA